MNAIADFFQRLLNVLLLFWILAFAAFDAVPLFGTILGLVGSNEILEKQSINGTGRAVILQVMVYLLAYVFCFIWRDFRQDIKRIANNMICLSLTISLLSCLLAILMQIFLNLSPLNEILGPSIIRFASDARDLPWDSRYTFAAIFFAFSYGLILINTLYLVGVRAFGQVLRSPSIVPLLASFIISLLASFVVTWPVLEIMNI